MADKRDYKRDTEARVKTRSSQNAAQSSYESFVHPTDQKSAFIKPWIFTGTAALLPIAALVYYFSQSDVHHPIVEKDDTPISDLVSEPAAPTQAIVNAISRNSVPENNPLEQERDQRMHERIREAKERAAKNWNQMAARGLDKEEIALAKRRMGVFNGTSGDIYAGIPNRAPSSVGKACPLMRPRSPDPQCHANYPCRICGACCCGCEAFLAGLSTKAVN